MNNISIIAAIGKNNELGKDNKLLWHISEDLKRFKNITSGHSVIMGRKTFNSIKNKALPNRRNIVITSDTSFTAPNIEIVHSIDEAMKLTKSEKEVFILGGATIYKQFIPYTFRMYLTIVHKAYEADIFFPEFDISQWQELERTDIKDDESVGVDYSFLTFERKL